MKVVVSDSKRESTDFMVVLLKPIGSYSVGWEFDKKLRIAYNYTTYNNLPLNVRTNFRFQIRL